MDQKKLDEIRAWWAEIEKLESRGKGVDMISFADAAHAYVPVLLAELDRLDSIRRSPSGRNRPTRPEEMRRPSPQDVPPLTHPTGTQQ